MTAIISSSTRSQRTLLHAFPTFAVGGSQIRFAAIANHFGPRYRHLIVPLDGVAACAERLGPQVDFKLLPIEVPKRNTLGNVSVLRQHLRRLSPDMLVTYNWGAIEWGLSNIFPLCRHLHIEDGFGPEEAARQLPRRVLMRRLVLTPWARVVLPSHALVRLALQTWKLPRGRVRYVPNGIDCDRFAIPADPIFATELRRRPGEVLIGTVAALRAEKNLSRLIQAFAALGDLPPTRLVIVGDGVERGKLAELAVSLGVADRVVFTGALSDPERVLSVLDIFALSSDTEQMPYSVLEAMGAGLAVASVDVGDVKDMVSDENRWAVVEKTTEALTQVLRDLISAPERRAVIGLANAHHVRRLYSQDAMFAAYGEEFDR